MKSPEFSDHIGYWRLDRLFRWDASLVSTLAISDASKSFMTETGLPILDRPVGGLGAPKWCASLPEYEADRSQRIVGMRGNIPILMRVGMTESITRGSFRVSGDGSNRLVEEEILNSSIWQYALLLAPLDQYQWNKGEFEDLDNPQRFDLLEARVREIDPDIWNNENSFWRRYIQGHRWAFEDGYD